MFLARGHGERSQGLSGAPSEGRSGKRRKRERKGPEEGSSGRPGSREREGSPARQRPLPLSSASAPGDVPTGQRSRG